MFDKRPPCPGDYRDYVWIESKERPHWRRKRGSHWPAQLNAGWQESSERTKIVSPASRKVRRAIKYYLRGISSGRLNNRISTAFRRSLKESDRMELRYLKGIELQRDHPLDEMLQCDYRVRITEKTIQLEIPIEKSCMKALNRLVTDYYFEAVLLYGNVHEEKGLDTISVESKLYSYYGTKKIYVYWYCPCQRKTGACF